MIEILQETWTAINEEFLTKLAESIKRRIKAIIKINDWYTRY